jgi:hypothetical protein
MIYVISVITVVVDMAIHWIGSAHEVYGVVLNRRNNSLDIEATCQQRLTIREKRLGGNKPGVSVGKRGEIKRTGLRINEYLQVAGSSEKLYVECTWCGSRICAANSQWKDYAVIRKSFQSIAGPLGRENGPFFLLEFFCPSCATLLDIDTIYQDDPPLYDKIYRWST